jgi:hypothetical protein
VAAAIAALNIVEVQDVSAVAVVQTWQRAAGLLQQPGNIPYTVQAIAVLQAAEAQWQQKQAALDGQYAASLVAE